MIINIVFQIHILVAQSSVNEPTSARDFNVT